MAPLPYATVLDAVRRAISREHPRLDPTVVAYMIMRSAMLHIRATHGSGKTAQLAYKLADEFATGSPK